MLLRIRANSAIFTESEMADVLDRATVIYLGKKKSRKLSGDADYESDLEFNELSEGSDEE